MSYNRSLMSVVWWKIIPTIHADIPVCCWDLEKESVPSMLLFLLKMNIGHLSGDDDPTRLNGRRIFEDDIVWNALYCKGRRSARRPCSVWTEKDTMYPGTPFRRGSVPHVER